MPRPPLFGGDTHQNVVPEAAPRPVVLAAPTLVNEAQLLVEGQGAAVVLEEVEVDLVWYPRMEKA